MSVGKCLTLAVLALGAACAPPGRTWATSMSRDTPPRTSTQVIVNYTFHITDGEIALESPGNPTVFDLAESTDGCLRGNVNRAGNLQEICRDSKAGASGFVAVEERHECDGLPRCS